MEVIVSRPGVGVTTILLSGIINEGGIHYTIIFQIRIIGISPVHHMCEKHKLKKCETSRFEVPQGAFSILGYPSKKLA